MNSMFSIVKRWRNSRNFTSIFSMACLFIPHPLLNLFTYFSGMEEATLRPFMADIAAIGFLAPYLRLAINYYFSFGRMNLDPREVSRYFGTEHHKVNIFYFKLIFDWNECQTLPYINNWNGKKFSFSKGLYQPWLFKNFFSFWILNQT